MQMKTIFLTLASAAFATAAFAEDPIKIGVPVGLSGANSVVAPSVVQAAELAVEEINAKGGVLGRPLALEIAEGDCVHRSPRRIQESGVRIQNERRGSMSNCAFNEIF